MNVSLKSLSLFTSALCRSSALRKIAVIYLGYCILTGVLAQPFLNYYLGKIYTEQTGRELKYDLISFNPISLTLSLSHATDYNPDGSVFWHFERADINLAFIGSLVRAAPGLDAFILRGFTGKATQDHAGNFNFSDIVAHQASLGTAPETEVGSSTHHGQLPRFFIGKIRLEFTSLHYTEHREQKDFTQSINNFLFRIDNLSSLRMKGQDYAFKAVIGDLGDIRWRGDLSLKAQQSQGEFSLSNIPLSPISDYLAEALKVTIDDGRLSVKGHYNLDWQDALIWSLNNVTSQLDHLKITSKQAHDVDFSLNQLAIKASTIDEESISVQSVAMDGLHLRSWSEGEEIGLIRALAFNDTAPTDEGNQNASDTAWQFAVDTVSITNSNIHWTVKDFNQLVIPMTDINFTAKNIASDGDQPSQFNFAANLNQKTQTGNLRVNGEVDITTLDGNLQVNLQTLPLVIVNPIIASFISGELTQGSLNATAHIQLKNAEPISVESLGSIHHLLLKPQDINEESVSFNALTWSNTQIDLQSETIHAGNISLDQLDGRFIITQSGSTNIDALLKNPQQDQAAEASSQNNWTIILDEFSLSDASFRFHDESLTPTFTAAVQNFSGSLDKLVSTDPTAAAFRFKGNVDGYAPVTLEGQTQPFLSDPLVNAKLNFKHLDLGGLSTYSSTYAGWRIERGQLSANLDYRLANNRILGDNHIEMDKLQLGERVRSAQAMDIPLRLALAMITDSNGRAVLNVGVSGDLDEPSFHIGKLIRDALTNSITKLVTSPFRLLASLVNSEDDLGVLPFNSGSSKILATANRRLNSLQAALDKRPALRIQLIGRIDPISDTRGLQILQANQLLLKQGLSASDIKEKNKYWEQLVEKNYRRQIESQTKDLTIDEKFEGWLATFPVAPEALEYLALERATRAKNHLVNTLRVDASRVFINGSQECQEEDPTECRRRIVKIDLTDHWDRSGLVLAQ